MKTKAPLVLGLTVILGSTSAALAGAGGTVYGGVTTQHYPVVLQMSKDGRKVIRAAIAIDLSCTSGGGFVDNDTYLRVPVKGRKFATSYGPQTERNDDGTTRDWQGSVSGTFNTARTNVSGKWSEKTTEYDRNGVVSGTCSASVKWAATQ